MNLRSTYSLFLCLSRDSLRNYQLILPRTFCPAAFGIEAFKYFSQAAMYLPAAILN